MTDRRGGTYSITLKGFFTMAACYFDHYSHSVFQSPKLKVLIVTEDRIIKTLWDLSRDFVSLVHLNSLLLVFIV